MPPKRKPKRKAPAKKKPRKRRRTKRTKAGGLKKVAAGIGAGAVAAKIAHEVYRTAKAVGGLRKFIGK